MNLCFEASNLVKPISHVVSSDSITSLVIECLAEIILLVHGDCISLFHSIISTLVYRSIESFLRIPEIGLSVLELVLDMVVLRYRGLTLLVGLL
jgi:hypothetical protein